MVAVHKRLLRQIEIVKKFQEIAKAVRFITGGELAKIRKDINRRFNALMSFIPLFFNKYLELPLSSTLSNIEMTHYDTDENEKVLVIPVCDDRGSCGSHNITVIYRASSLIDDLKLQNNTIKVYPFGLKGKQYCQEFYYRDMIGSSTGLGDMRFSLDMCFFYAEKFISGGFDKYYLVFNRFFSMQQQYPAIYCLCSFNQFVRGLLKNSFVSGNIYYDAILDKCVYDNFLEDLYTFGFSIFLLDALNENRYSFLGARFSAMDQMINNTQDMLESLVIKYNKVRQESITTELLEILGCKDVVLEQKK